MREITFSNIHNLAREGRFGEPVKIESADDLKELLPDERIRELLTSRIDFDKEHLFIFAWSGSGRDRLEMESTGEEAMTLTFKYSAGRTRDLRQHVKLFVAPQDATIVLD